jgi:hypothetical protein
VIGGTFVAAKNNAQVSGRVRVVSTFNVGQMAAAGVKTDENLACETSDRRSVKTHVSKTSISVSQMESVNQAFQGSDVQGPWGTPAKGNFFWARSVRIRRFVNRCGCQDLSSSGQCCCATTEGLAVVTWLAQQTPSDGGIQKLQV